MKSIPQLKINLRFELAALLLICLAGSALVLLSGFRFTPEKKAKSIRTLIVGGGTSHDFDKWYKQADATMLEKDGFASVTYTDNTDSIAAYLPNTDVLYLTNNQPISDPKVRKAIFDFVSAGHGLVLGHAALWYNWKDWPEYNQQLVSGGTRSHDKYGNFQVNVVEKHPVTKGVKSFTLDDELYHYEPDQAGPGIEVLAEATTEGGDTTYPSIFVVENPNSRIVGFALGHDAASHDLPQYQQLLRNAIQWAAH